MSFVAAFVRGLRDPAVRRRCLRIALAVGSILSLVNQGDALWRGSWSVALASRVTLNYLIPFVVSNLGAMSSPSGSAGAPHG